MNSQIQIVLQALNEAECLYHRLVLLVGESGSGKTTVLQEVCNEIGLTPVNLNLELSQLMLEMTVKQRTLQLPKILEEMVNNTDSKIQQKGPTEYRQIMTDCFKESYIILKSGRWMTVEFSNTKASVWNNIQTALTEAGFIVANVSVSWLRCSSQWRTIIEDEFQEQKIDLTENLELETKNQKRLAGERVQNHHHHCRQNTTQNPRRGSPHVVRPGKKSFPQKKNSRWSIRCEDHPVPCVRTGRLLLQS